jgi:hypothetical protein
VRARLALLVVLAGLAVLALVLRAPGEGPARPDDTARPARTATTQEDAASPVTAASLPRARVVRGVFVDEEGNPVVDAGVSAWANGTAWARQQGFLGCDAGLFTCGSIDAAKALLAHARAGTLPFPEPLASTRTDAEGGFTLEGPLDDALLVGTVGREQLFLGVDELPEPILRRYGVEEHGVAEVLAVRRDDAPAADVELTVINPFTREVQTGRTDRQGELAITVTRPWYWAAAEAPGCNVAVKLPASSAALEVAPPRTLRVQLRSAEGPIDGEVRAWCQGADYVVSSRDAGVTLTDVPGSSCTVMADSAGLSSPAKQLTFDAHGRADVTLTLAPMASLTITVFDALTGEPVGDGAVLLRQPDSAAPPRALLIKAGQRGVLRQTEPRTLLLETSFTGYLPETRDVVLVPGTTDVEFALRRARRLTGEVVDATGAPVQHATVTARFAGAGPRPRGSDADGGFAFDVDEPGPWLLTAVSHTHGSARAEVTAPGHARLALAAKNELLVSVEQLPKLDSAQATLTRVDGASLPQHRGSLSIWQGPGRAVDLPPGEYRLVTTREGFMPSEQTVTLPAEGTVSVRVKLERGHAVSGVVLDEQGRPAEDVMLGIEFADAGTAALLGSKPFASTDARGRFTFEHLPPRPVVISANLETVRGAVEATPPARGVTLRLAPAPRWTGRAVDASGKPLTRFVANDEEVTNAEGRFDVAGSMLDLKAGELTAYETGRPREVGDVVLRGARAVRVRVLRPGGAPAVKARVLFRGVGHYYRVTDDEGRVTYSFTDDGRETRVKMYVVHSEGYGFLEGTSAQETTVTLSPWLRVEGRVEDERGEGVADDVVVDGLELVHEVRLAAGADGRFVARVAPGTWAFRTGGTAAGLVVKIDRDGQKVVLKPGTGPCELHLSGDDYDEVRSTLTLARADGEGLQRLPFQPGADVAVPCGRWRATLAQPDGGLATAELELQPPRARLTSDARGCEHPDDPCFVLAPAVRGP